MNIQYRVTLSEAEQALLEGILSGGRPRASEVERAQILLAAAKNQPEGNIARTCPPAQRFTASNAASSRMVWMPPCMRRIALLATSASGQAGGSFADCDNFSSPPERQARDGRDRNRSSETAALIAPYCRTGHPGAGNRRLGKMPRPVGSTNPMDVHDGQGAFHLGRVYRPIEQARRKVERKAARILPISCDEVLRSRMSSV